MSAQTLQFKKDANDARLEKYGRLLYDEAPIAALARTVNELLVSDAAR